MLYSNPILLRAVLYYKKVVLSGVFALMLIGSISLKAAATPRESTKKLSAADSAINGDIQLQLNDLKNQGLLNYPLSVANFYKNTSFEPAWIVAGKQTRYTWDAMLLIDCVLQYGLSYADFHPQQLSNMALQQMLDNPYIVSGSQKARFDILLTDAMVTFINHLHYGKLNPDYPISKTDGLTNNTFNAELVLTQAMQGKDFTAGITNVQPPAPEYALLQDQMRLIKGQYVGDCYEIPESEVRKIAINMERLRWANTGSKIYLHINVPSYTLKFYRPDTVYQFKVIVGKPDHETPVLQSAVRYFTTSPEWNVPPRIFANEILPKALRDPQYLESNNMSIYDSRGNYVAPTASMLAKIKGNPGSYAARQSSGCENSLGKIIFRFPNVYNVYLHDTPQQELFRKDERAFSHGCIRVEQAGKLAELILRFDGKADKIPAMRKAMQNCQRRTFYLNKPVDIKVTYLTCEVKNGIIVNYKDVYDLDKRMEMALYGVDEKQLTMSK